jgi:hypothetical protein
MVFPKMSATITPTPMSATAMMCVRKSGPDSASSLIASSVNNAAQNVATTHQ